MCLKVPQNGFVTNAFNRDLYKFLDLDFYTDIELTLA